MSKCVIKKIRGQGPPINPHIARILGQQFVPKPIIYLHTESGQEFSHIAGGLAYPSAYAPGFVAVVGVDWVEGDAEPPIRVLDEAESHTVEGLLNECLKLRERYGYPEYRGILDLWIGDHERFLTLVGDFNLKHSKDNKHGVYIAPPPDLDQPDHFEIFMRRLQGLLGSRKAGKRLFLEGSTPLQNQLQNLPPDALDDADRFPALLALGGLVHHLMSVKPWMQPTSSVMEQTFETVAVQAAEEEREWLGLDDMDFGEIETYDGQEIIDTMDTD